jgi:hypothetical protein
MNTMKKHNVTTTLLFLAIAFVVGIIGMIALDRNMSSAATEDLRPAVEAKRASIPAVGVGQTFQLLRHVDFADDPAGDPVTSYTILTIPMNTYVRAIVTKVTRAEGAADEFDIQFSNLTAESETVKVNEVSLATINAAAITAIDEIKTTDTLVSINTGADGDGAGATTLTVAAVDIWILCERLPGISGDED